MKGGEWPQWRKGNFTIRRGSLTWMRGKKEEHSAQTKKEEDIKKGKTNTQT